MAIFSVVIPVYKHCRYVRQAVISALRSPLVEEVLIADDGSPDGSREAVAELAAKYAPRVRDLTGAPAVNLGAHRRLNQLVEEARCEWVAALNSDDVFVDGRFEAIAAHPGFPASNFVFGNLLLMNGQGALIGAKRGPFDTGTPFPGAFDVRAMVEAGNLLDLLAHQNYIGTTSNMIFTKSLHARIRGFSPFRYVHDWDFALRACVLGQPLYVQSYLTAYRMHSGNTILESAAKVDAESRRVFDSLLADFPGLAGRPEFRIALDAAAK